MAMIEEFKKVSAPLSAKWVPSHLPWAHLHWLSRAEACLSETNNVDSHWKGAGFFYVRRSCLTTMVVVPSCCKAMRSMHLSTFGIEWRLAHQNSKWCWFQFVQIWDSIPWCSGAADGPCHLPSVNSLECLKSGSLAVWPATYLLLEYMIHERTIATWRWAAATLWGCFVKWRRSPASLEIPNCILKSHKQLCSIRSCSCIRYRGPLSRASCTCHCMGMNKWMHVDCLHIHDLQKKLHRPSSLRFPPKRSLLVTVLCLQVCYSRSRFARSTCSVVRQKARTFAVEVCSVRSFSFHWLKQHEFVRRSFGGEQVTGPNMSNTSWLSRTEAGPKMGRNVVVSLKFC